ncbi:MAG: hypothetical protein K2G77_06580, partial [Muribaculaceae bacterium]|nr:hypothetical protein [Muribaculaceae bacterium]
MKKLLGIVIVLTVSLAAKAFVVNVSDLPEAVINYPIAIISELDNKTLDSIQPECKKATLHGNLDKAELCKLKYSFDIEGGVRTNFIPVFLGAGNDTVNIRLTENYENGRVVVAGGELNDRREGIWKDIKNLKRDELVEYIKKQAIENISNPLGAYLVSVISSSLNHDIWMGLYHEMPADMAEYPMLKNEAERLRAVEATGDGRMFQDMPCLTPDGKQMN